MYFVLEMLIVFNSRIAMLLTEPVLLNWPGFKLTSDPAGTSKDVTPVLQE
jgi:hypothetical protein